MTEQSPLKEQLLSRLRDGIAAAEGNLSRNEIAVSVHSHWLKDTCQVALAVLQSSHEPCPEWRCFHCDVVFTDHDDALAHFGPHIGSEPACIIDAAKYREMERTVESYCAEDTELHRALHAKDSEMQTKIRQAEETGYARGLEDAKKHPEELGLARAAQPPRAWQPIETAPKGIKLIAGYPNKLGKWRSVMACYYLPGTLTCDDDTADEDGYAPEGWYEESESHDHLLHTDETPTHWMPLPSSPLTKGEGQ